MASRDALLLRDGRTGREIGRLAAPGSSHGCAAWSPDGRRIATAGDDDEQIAVHVWDPAGGPPLVRAVDGAQAESLHVEVR